MLSADKFESHAARLVDPNISSEARRELATEIRDSIDLFHSQDYQSFLNIFLPAFRTVLTQLTRPQFVDNPVHRVRALIMETLNRLPHNDILKTRLSNVLSLAMDTLKTDNENNAVVAIHIVLDLHKNFRNHLDGQVQPFLDFVRVVYDGFGKTVEQLLNASNNIPVPGKPPQVRLAPSTQSFKVIIDCPLLIMLIFQLYPQLVQKNISVLFPLMVQAIQYEIPIQLFAKIPKTTFNDFIAAQVKTVSFLAYLMKQFSDRLSKDESSVPRSVVKLMQSCPGGAVSIRKELIVATRHILGGPYGKGFYGQLDLLLDEKVLVGTGRASTDALRPIAYSFLAELVHGMRLELSIPQLEKIVFMFSTNVHDPKFNYQLQTSSVRLLLNLIEGILKIERESSEETLARELLVKILETMVSKFATLGEEVPRLLKTVQDLREEKDPIETGRRLCETPVGDPLREVADFKVLLKTLTLGLKTVIWSAINSRVDKITADRAMQQNTVLGPPSNQGGRQSALPAQKNAQNRLGLLERESQLVSSLLSSGRKCFRLYARHEKANGGAGVHRSAQQETSKEPRESSPTKAETLESQQNLMNCLSQNVDPSRLCAATETEEIDAFELFSQIFTVLDPPSFQDVFGSRIREVFEYIVEDPIAIAIPQHFLSNNGVSKYFADILLNFLVENIQELEITGDKGSEDYNDRRNRANAILRMFTIVFASVNIYPTNEPVLHMHLATIVRKALMHASSARNPVGFLQMLKALFKAVNNEKNKSHLELLYWSFVPLLEYIFDTLIGLVESPCGALHKDLLVELCLLVPARTSHAFPYLEKLMRPIVWALEVENEASVYGIRALEFWVDILQPSYLDRLLAKVEPGLTVSLHKHLRQPRNPIGAQVLRVIGKLGSRSRFVRGLTIPFKYEKRTKNTPRVRLEWPGGVSVNMEIEAVVRLTVECLLGRRRVQESTEGSYRLHAWKFLFSCLNPFLEHGNGGQAQAVYGLRLEDRGRNGSNSSSSIRKSRRTVTSETDLVKNLLLGLILCTSALRPEHEQSTNGDIVCKQILEMEKDMKGMCSFFALLTLQESSQFLCSRNEVGLKKYKFSSHKTPVCLSYKVFVDVLVEVMSQESRRNAGAGLLWMQLYISNLSKYCAQLQSTCKAKNAGEKSDTKAEGEVEHVPMKGVSAPSDDEKTSLASLLKQSDTKEDCYDNDPPIDETELSRSMVLTEGSSAAGSLPCGRQSLHIAATVSSLGYMIDVLSHFCYKRSWKYRWVAVNGFTLLVKNLPRDVLLCPAYVQYYMLMYRALLFLLRDSTEFSSEELICQGRTILCDSFEVIFAGLIQADERKGSSATYRKCLREVVVRLLMDLLSASATARETARTCLRVVSKTLNCDVSELVLPLKECILRPLQERPLRQHSIATQLGYLEATNFCLKLDGPQGLSADFFSSPTREYVLIESIYLLENNSFDPVPESEEAFKHKLHESKYIDAATSKELLLLKRQAVEVLRNISVHCSEQLKQPVNDTLYKNTISCFFKNIQSRDDKIVQSSKQGLRQAIERHHRPKELLQQNIRPMLAHLGDYKMLNIPYLQGLSRILELFSNWFNISLGEKLLEHLQKWTDPEKITSIKKIPVGTESRVAAAILELFHLLPTSAGKFLPRVVDMVIRLEAVLTLAAPGAAHLGLKSAKSASTSPYRAPLLKYCEKHASEAAEVLLSHLGDEKFRQLFFVLIGTRQATSIRKVLVDNPKRLFSPSFFHVDGGNGKTLHMIALLDLLSKTNPTWLGSDPVIMSTLISYWKTFSTSNDLCRQDPSSSFRVQELKILAHIFIRYCATFKNEVNLLFELLAVFSFRTTCDFTFVKHFLQSTVTQEKAAPAKNSILNKFFSVFLEGSTTQERKLYALHYIIIPLVSHHLKKKGTGKLHGHQKLSGASRTTPTTKTQSETSIAPGPRPKDGEGSQKTRGEAKAGGEENHSAEGQACISAKQSSPFGSANEGSSTDVETQDSIDPALVQKIVTDILDQSDETLRCYDELLSVELLRLATVLIKHTPLEINRYRKELIKFGWNNLKREESTAKFWAFIAVTQFFESYQAPTKLVLQVYVALLRACQVDGKHLVQRALDTLMPVLPRHLIHNPTDHKYPIWIRYTKKILLEEGHSIQNLVHIWQIIARHPQLFFLSRAQFVPFIINSLSRFALSANALPENRRLGLDLVDLILSWEDTRRRNDSEIKPSATGDDHVLGQKKRARDQTADSGNGDEQSAKSNRATAAQELGPPSKLQKASDGHPVPTAPPTTTHAVASNQDADHFKPNASMVDIMASFLVQMPIRPADQREASLITRRSLKLLERMLQLWPRVSIRINFVEKLLTPIPSERQGATSSAAPSGKGPQNGPLGDNNATDGKTPKPTRSDKDQMKKRLAVRNSALVTSLLVSSVAVKYQGLQFVEQNRIAIRAFIQPSVTENSVSLASQFASLLPGVLENYKKKQPGITSVKSSHPKNTVEGGEQHKLGLSSEKREQQLTDTSGQKSSSLQSSSQSWMMTFIKELHAAVDMCLKSSEHRRNYCGLVVLKSLWTALPQEFMKYQDVLLKSLQKLTKEHKSSSQAPTVSVGASSVSGVNASGGRAQQSSEKKSGVQGQVTPSKGSNAKVSEGGNDSGKNAKAKADDEKVQSKSYELDCLRLCLSMVEFYINSLDPTPKRHTLSTIGTLIEKCTDIDVLLELVKLVDSLVFWNSKGLAGQSGSKEPLTPKEKAQLLQKMAAFDKISTEGSQILMDAYLSIILKSFKPGESSPRRPDPKLERVFMIGLRSYGSALRQEFFEIYESAVGGSASVRLQYIVSKQEWEHLAETLWIRNAVELLICSIEKSHTICFSDQYVVFPRLSHYDGDTVMTDIVGNSNASSQEDYPSVSDETLWKFETSVGDLRTKDFTQSLISLVNCDQEIASKVWILLVPEIWSQLTPSEQSSLNRSFGLLLTKEYHYIQVTWPRNSIQTLLESIVELKPLPALRANVVRCVGARWNAWHSAFKYFERRERDVRVRLGKDTISERTRHMLEDELEDIADAQVNMYLGLHESDNVAGLWKTRARSKRTIRAISYEQIGCFADAQDAYAEVLGDNMSRVCNQDEANNISGNEVLFCEERWIECAKSLCQWDVLTEFSRTVVSPNLLHECLWRIPDWMALKDLVWKKPIQDSSKLQIYEAYIHFQDNKLGHCEKYINEGFKRAMEKFAALPESGDLDAVAPILVQFQQLIELQESGRILGELNALSRHGSDNVNVDQKIENVRIVLNTWRERLPSAHEPLWVWNELLLWRNHVHAVVVNVLEALKEAANAKIDAAQNSTAANTLGSRGGAISAQVAQVQAANAIAQALPQHVLVMGVNETAWNVHRFAKACRKQGFPDVALYVLQKLYPFGTMELTEYFVKIKEVARAYMVGPRGLEKHLENGLHELSRCNMDHLGPRQRAQLFSLKGKLLTLLGKEDESIEAVSTALFTSADVGSAWLSWGQHCDKMQRKAAEDPSAFANFADSIDSDDKQIEELMGVSNGYAAELAFRESAVKCYLQAVRFGSRKGRAYLSRVLRLLSLDVQSRLSCDFTTRRLMEHQSCLTSNATKAVDMPQAPEDEKGLEKNSTSAAVVAADNASADKQKGATNKPGTLSSERKGVSRALSAAILDVPSWMWIPWLPQLLQMLGRAEGLTVMPILSRIALTFPQAIFFPLKAYMDDRKAIDMPRRQLFREALKLWRPVAKPLRTVATSAHLKMAARSVHQLKEHVQKFNAKYVSLRKEIEKLDEAAQAGGQDQARLMEQKEELRNTQMNVRKILERCLREYHGHVQRHRQIQESLPSSSHAGSHGVVVGSANQSGSAAAVGGKGDNKAEKQPEVNKANGNEGEAGAQKEGVGEHKAVGETKQAAARGGGADASKRAQPQSRPTSRAASSATPYELADNIMAQIAKHEQALFMELESVTSELSFRVKIQKEELLLGLMNALLLRCYQSGIKSWKEQIMPGIRGALEEISRSSFGIGVEGSEQAGGEQHGAAELADVKEAFAAELAPQTAKDFPSDVDTFIRRLRRWQGIFQRRVDALPEYVKLENICKQLLNVNGSEVEVFGQYCDMNGSEPCVRRHVRIGRISGDVKVMQRATGCCRGMAVLGSDGKWYKFVVEHYVRLHVQMAETRAGQMYRLLNEWVFGKDAVAVRQRVQLAVPRYIATGCRSRLVCSDGEVGSVSEGLEQYLERRGESCDDVIMAFREAEAEAKERRMGEKEEALSVSEVFEARVEALEAVCRRRVGERVFAEWVAGRMRTGRELACFRKRFGETAGCGSAASYALAIGCRRPQNMMFCWESGAVQHGGVRVLSSSAGGVLEHDEAVPFRLTRNLRRGLGANGNGVKGVFYGSLVRALRSMMGGIEVMETVLESVMRDEVEGYVVGEQGLGGVAKTEEGRLDDTERVERALRRSVAAMRARVWGAGGSGGGKEGEGGGTATAAAAAAAAVALGEALVEKACAVGNVARMDSSFQAWY